MLIFTWSSLILLLLSSSLAIPRSSNRPETIVEPAIDVIANVPIEIWQNVIQSHCSIDELTALSHVSKFFSNLVDQELERRYYPWNEINVECLLYDLAVTGQSVSLVLVFFAKRIGRQSVLRKLKQRCADTAYSPWFTAMISNNVKFVRDVNEFDPNGFSWSWLSIRAFAFSENLADIKDIVSTSESILIALKEDRLSDVYGILNGDKPYSLMVSSPPPHKATLLELAISKGNKELTFHLINNRAFSLQHYYNNPIYTAAKHRQTDILVSLMAAGFSIDQKDVNGLTQLHGAVLHDLPHAVNVLLLHGASVNMRDDKKRTPLFYVRSRMVVDLLIENEADINSLDDNGNSPLIGVCMAAGERCFRDSRDLEVIRGLILAGGSNAIINHQNSNNETALHYVLYNSDNNHYYDDLYDILYSIAFDTVKKKIIELMLAYGADPFIQDCHGRQPIVKLIESKDWSIHRLLKQQTDMLSSSM